ncbi:ComF family protein [Jongsikchunia kroppenstedtii]|uniref:ComF family protein n=1 Tax=Jongsikchunia kroppenstedtii TaxID=1121721 RepID=UPI0003775821|nr:ComF family protein [Jongsikchunia kroppenstedtii]
MTTWRPLAALTDLMVPELCGGCGRPGAPWCGRCAAALADVPVELTPRVPLPVTAWALGRYRGPHREAIIALKEHGRRDLADPLGQALAFGLVELHRWTELPDRSRLRLIPAPTRLAAARRRGGDPVTAVCRCAADHLGSRVRVAAILRTRALTRDSAGLSAAQRSANLSGSVRLVRDRSTPMPRPGEDVAVLVDDVLTTGATAAESVAVLAAAGVVVDAVLVIAGA